MRRYMVLTAALSGIAAGSTGLAVHAEQFNQTVAADPHGVVEISNVAGHVEVQGWDRAEVHAEATLSASSMRVEVLSSTGHTSIRVIYATSTWFGGGGHANLIVQVPRGSEVDVTAVSADVRSSGVQGRQRLQSVSGEVDADAGPGDAEVKTVSGSAHVTGKAAMSSVRIGSVSGEVRLEHGAGSIEAQSVSGSISIVDSDVQRLRMRTTSGDARFTGKLERGASVEGESVSGEITLKVAPATGYDYDVSTFSGDIENCFGQVAQRASEYGPGHNLRGTRGTAGDARVRVNTMSGDVSLCDH